MDASGLVIREAGVDDVAAILTLMREDLLNPVSEPGEVTANHRAAVAEIAADPNLQLLVGEIDGRVVATAHVAWMRMLMADGGLYCQVEAVRTASGLRGRGIGRQLMDEIEDEARRRGATRMQLTSNRQREDAHRFYERLGYEATHVGMKKYL